MHQARQLLAARRAGAADVVQLEAQALGEQVGVVAVGAQAALRPGRLPHPGRGGVGVAERDVARPRPGRAAGRGAGRVGRRGRGRGPRLGPVTVAGVATDCCVLSTVLPAADAGVLVRVVSDACAGADDEAHDDNMRLLGCYAPLVEVTTTAEVLVDA